MFIIARSIGMVGFRYFQSRPHLLGGGTKNVPVETVAIAAAPAALALHQAAVKNPKAAASLMTTGAKTLNKWNQNQNGQSVSGFIPKSLFFWDFSLISCSIRGVVVRRVLLKATITVMLLRLWVVLV